MKRAIVLFSAFFSLLTASSALAQEIVFRHDKSGWEKGFQALAEGIKAETGVNVSLQLQNPVEYYMGFIQTSIVGNNPPPLFTWWNGKQLDLLAATGKIANLSAAWDKAIAAGFFSEEEKKQVSVNGVPYAIPLNVARYPVLYRKDAFQKTGIAHPPKTWEELIEAAEKLKAAGYIPFNAPGGGQWESSIWFAELMIRTNPDAFEGLGNGTVRYNGPEVQAAFALWGDFFDKGYFGDPRETIEETARQFINGQAAMWLTAEWYVGGLQKRGLAPGKDFGAFFMPCVKPDTPDSVVVETAIIAASRTTLEKYPAVVDYLLSLEAGEALANAPTTNVFNGNLKIDPPNAIVAEVNDLLATRKPRQIMRWWESAPPEIQGDLVAQMGAFVFNPTAENAQKVMNNMEDFNKKYWNSKVQQK